MVQHSLHEIFAARNKKLTPSELVKKHLENPNHVLTESELSRVELGGFPVQIAGNKKTGPKPGGTISAATTTLNPYDYIDI